jgi:hypothetical protein
MPLGSEGAREGSEIAEGGDAHILPSGAQENGTRLARVDVDGYDPGDLQIIDKAIRHMPGVVAYMVKAAQECINLTGVPDEFTVILQNDPNTQRPRAYCAPNTSDGIHLELTEQVLLKSAISMEDRTL